MTARKTCKKETFGGDQTRPGYPGEFQHTHMKRFLLPLFCVLQLTAVFLPGAHASERLVLIHPGSAGSLYDISALEFAERLASKLPEDYSITVQASTSLGDGIALLDSVRNGRATFALAYSGLVALSDTFALFELPFLFRSRSQIPAIRQHLLEPYLQPEAGRYGLRILGVWESGFRHITNNTRPVETPDDLAGLRIAVPKANAWRQNVLRAFGAEPVPAALRVFSQPLEASRINGQEAPLLQIAALNLPEMQFHMALSDHLYSPAFLVTSNAAFASLPENIQRLINDEARAMESWIQEIAIRIESDLIDRLDQSMKLTHIRRGPFLEAARPLYAEFTGMVPDGEKMIGIVRTFKPQASDNLGAFIEPEQGSTDK